jgi:hypothetical protein
MAKFIRSSGTPTASSANVTSTSASALAANPTVIYRCFKNCSTSVAVWLGFGAPAVVNSGICIEPRGTYEMAYEYDNMFPGQVFAISEGANLALGIMEEVEGT